MGSSFIFFFAVAVQCVSPAADVAMKYGPNLVPEALRTAVVSNDDTNRRVVSVHKLPQLQFGKTYLFEADVTVPGRIKGPYRKGAVAFIEYMDASGKWLGGSYLEEQMFTEGKPKRISSIMTLLKKSAASFVIGTGLSKGCTGVARFDSISVREVKLPPPQKVGYRYENVSTGRSPRVWIDTKGRTVVDGRRFFPFGVYGGVGESHIGRFKGGPFNTLMVYGAPSRDDFDRAAANGLKVIAGVNHYFAGFGDTAKSVKSVADEEPQLAAYVDSVKGHPALLAWYAFDELPITMLPQLVRRRSFLERVDPNHPVWAVMNNWEFSEHYLGAFDVAGCDPYPIPNNPISDVAEAVGLQRSQTSGRAVWVVPQIFSWANYSRKDGRPPTRDEIRNMTWQAIVEGANGIIYFKYGDLLNNNGGKNTFETRWADLMDVAWEVRRFMPVLLTDEPEIGVSGQTGSVRARALAHGGDVYLVVVNTSCESGRAKLDVSGFSTYEADLKPLEVRVFNLTKCHHACSLAHGER